MVSPKASALITIERDDVEFDVEVRGVVYPPTRATFTDPGSDAEVECLVALRCDDGREVMLDEVETRMAEEALLLSEPDDGPDPDRAWDDPRERDNW